MATRPAKDAAAAIQPKLTPDFSGKDYGIFFLAGALCCTVTHGAMTPIDVVKTRIQIDNSLKGNSMMVAGRKIVAAEGTKGLMTGEATPSATLSS